MLRSGGLTEREGPGGLLEGGSSPPVPSTPRRRGRCLGHPANCRSDLGRELAFGDEDATEAEDERVVHGENMDGDSSDGGEADEARASPAKVVGPEVAAGVEERDDLAHFECRGLRDWGPWICCIAGRPGPGC